MTIVKRIATLCIAAALLFSFAGCLPRKSGSDVKVAVWTAGSAEKFMRDEDYSARYAEGAVLGFDVMRNETESAQIMLSILGEDFEAFSGTKYTVEAGDLTASDGTKLGKEQFKLYHEKYIDCALARSGEKGMGYIGYYPDAIVPYENIVACDENRITGRNQGVWVAVKPSADQKAGVYTGNFTVTAATKTFSLPVRVRVRDYTLSDEVHAKTDFGLSAKDIAMSEQDGTSAMRAAYWEFMLEHRVFTNFMPDNLDGESAYIDLSDPDTFESFVSMVEKYALDPRCGMYDIPCTAHYAVENIHLNGEKCTGAGCEYHFQASDVEYFKKETDVPQVGETCNGRTKFTYSGDSFNPANFKAAIIGLIKRSMEKGVNLLEKAYTYLLIHDEYSGYEGPDGRSALNSKSVALAGYSMKQLKIVCENAATEMADELICEDESAYQTAHGVSYETLKEKVLESARTVKHKLVGFLVDELGAKNAVMVPMVQNANTKADQEKYEEYAANSGTNEMWMYTCLEPRAPYPNYMIDSYLLAPRVYSWMRYSRNVVGDLYWAVNKMTDKNNNPLQDYYDTPERFTGTVGDGFLLYPGRPYGVYGPVSSIRFEAITDGLEEYDALYDLENRYGSRVTGEKFDNVLSILTHELYSDMRLRTRDGMEDFFAESRAALLDLLELSANLDAAVVDYEKRDGNAYITFSAPQGVETVTQAAVDSSAVVNGYNVTVYKVPLDKERNGFSLTASLDGKSYSLSLQLGGKTSSFDGSTLAAHHTDKRGTVTVSTSAINETQTTEVTFNGYHFVHFEAKYLGLTSATERLSVDLYNNGDEAVAVNVYVNRGKVASVTILPHAWATVSLQANTEITSGILERISFEVRDGDDEALQNAVIDIGKIELEG